MFCVMIIISKDFQTYVLKDVQMLVVNLMLCLYKVYVVMEMKKLVNVYINIVVEISFNMVRNHIRSHGFYKTYKSLLW